MVFAGAKIVPDFILILVIAMFTCICVSLQYMVAVVGCNFNAPD